MADCSYSATISEFLAENEEQVFGKLACAASVVEGAQGSAWFDQIKILKESLPGLPEQALVHFELSVPRLGKRIDAVLVLKRVLFVIEFKVGADEVTASARDQVWDYALDLKNFHLTSHAAAIVPVLVATGSNEIDGSLVAAPDLVYRPVTTNAVELGATLRKVESQVHGPTIDVHTWLAGAYRPTPTIIEAASALYAGHGVANISRSGAEERNLSATSDALGRIIEAARKSGQKAICFVTGVPGAGKTLVGLNVATQRPENDEAHAVYLSGNGPLVEVLTEALARDEVSRKSGSVRKGEARRLVSKFIQNVHHYRDAYLKNSDVPFERVAIFDEAQRAWDFQQTAHFMRQRRGIANFPFSEPEYLISCMERHAGWAVVALPPTLATR